MTTVTPQFSIIIPCYNQANFLHDAVKSALEQDFDSMEIIIVNDGSSDNTSEIAKALVAKYAPFPIKVIDQPNLGISVARNTGINKASAAWITPLDADNMLAAGFLQTIADSIVKYPYANAFTGACKDFGAHETDWLNGRNHVEKLTTRCIFGSSTTYQKNLWKISGGYDPSHPWGYQDWHFWLKCLPHGLSLMALSAPMMYKRTYETIEARLILSQHAPVALAMLHTMQPKAFPRPTVVGAHEILRGMTGESVAAVQKKRNMFPTLPLPHFWLGLAMEGRGDIAMARNCYDIALKHPWAEAWQAQSRLKKLA